MKHLFLSSIASSLFVLVSFSTALAQATCPADRSVCENEAPFTLSGGTPAGGTYSGPGVSGGAFSPSIARTGAKIITYTGPDGLSSCTFTITVNPAPQMQTAMGFSPECINIGIVYFTKGFGTLGSIYTVPDEPITVTWTGPGITGDPVAGYQFDPVAAGVGYHRAYATATTSHGCTAGPAQSEIALDGAANVSCPASQTVSVVAAPFTLTGAVNLTQTFNNGVAPGQYSGTGVTSSTSTFNPAIAGIGNHQITYTGYSTCEPAATCTFNMVVTAAPPTCPADRSACIDEAPFALSGGSPAGGTYSGPGVSGGLFYPSIAGKGAKVITYTDQSGQNTCTFTITVNHEALINLTTGYTPFCINETPSPIGGFAGMASGTTIYGEPYTVSWVGPNGPLSQDYIFDPAAAGVGQHDFYGTATTIHGCSSIPQLRPIVIEGASAVSCPGDIIYQVSDDSFRLTGAQNLTPSAATNPPAAITDAGGVYSGTGVNSATGFFTPSAAGVGVHQITYTVDTGCGPAASCTFNAKTTSLPVKLVSFAARKNENKILLSWKTSEETGFDRFEIEKSENPKKGFVNIGQVTGKGVSHTYSFLDNTTVTPGTPVYYRLKMVDLDGTFAYSKIVWESVDGAKVMTVYPNPVSGELSVLSQSGLVDIQLINTKGVTVISQKPEQSKINSLDVSRLPVGTYIIRTKDIHGQIYQSKVVVQR